MRVGLLRQLYAKLSQRDELPLPDAGLTDSNGVEQIDYSNGLLSPLNENSLSRAPLRTFAVPRSILWAYNPLINSVGQLAQRHCDGTTDYRRSDGDSSGRPRGFQARLE